MNEFLRKIHRWFGFPLGLLFLITFATGFLTAFDELLSRTEYSDFNYRETSLSEDAQAITVIIQGKEGIRQIAMPMQGTPYYQVSMRGEHFTYAIDDLRHFEHEKTDNEGFFKTVLQLHRNFLLGKDGLWGVQGSHYVAWLALLALLMSLIGFWLWWPIRKTFQARNVVPVSTQRKDLYYSHMTAGVVTLVAITLLALTGASISYRSISQQILGVEEGTELQTNKSILLEKSWQSWLTAAYTAVPGGELNYVRFPRSTAISRRTNTDIQSAGRREQAPKEGKSQILEFRFYAPGDWLGLANSKVQIDMQQSTLIGVTLFEDLSLGEKIYSMLVPLHTGRNLHPAYVVVLLLLSAIGVMMVFSGLVSFVKKRRNFARILRFTMIRNQY